MIAATKATIKKGAASPRLLSVALVFFFALFGVRWLASAFTVSIKSIHSSAECNSLPMTNHQPEIASSSDLTAHEWGTFTSISGPDGQPMDWLALTGSTNLPSFIEHFRDVKFKGGLSGTVRMETPVLYFYSPHEADVSVDVSFSRGVITEWYPHADSVNPQLNDHLLYLYAQSTPGSISWNSVHINPQAAPDFPSDHSENSYYAARQTSSAPLELSNTAVPQREKFLFYRGVAAFPPPLSATLSPGNTVELQNEFTDSISNVILFERRGAKLGYRILGPLRDQAALSLPTLDGSLDSLTSTLEGFLISQGLFPDEAHAMLETWKNSWFEEGARLIYMVPRPFVDSVLPLTIKPAANITRVFVGRLELITPATQHAVESAFATGDRATLAKYSRFLEPILLFMLQQSPGGQLEKRLLGYLNSVTSAPNGKFHN